MDYKNLLVKYTIDTLDLYTVHQSGVFIGQMPVEISDSIENVDPEFYEAFSEDANNSSMYLSKTLDSFKIKSFWSDKHYVKFENWTLDMRKLDILSVKVLFLIKGKHPLIFDIQDVDNSLLKKHFLKKTA